MTRVAASARRVAGAIVGWRPANFAPGGVLRFGWSQLEAIQILRRSGLVPPPSPLHPLHVAQAAARWGVSPVAAFEASALTTPERTFVVDEAGEIGFAAMREESDALALALRGKGVRPGTAVGLLARNHAGWVRAALALWKCGADSVYLNTSFAAPEVKAVAGSENLQVLLCDDEFRRLPIPAVRKLSTEARWWQPFRPAPGIEPPGQTGRYVILTSGTTGRPRGAPRAGAPSLDAGLGILARIPLHAGETTVIASPLFHAWGFANLLLGLLLGSTLVLQRGFDPEAVLAAVARHRASALVAVPLMLERVLALPARSRHRYDLSSLRVVAVSGSALAPRVATKFMDEFGDVVYNLYGSTEVGWATIAGPDDLRRAPGTVGRPARGSVVRILDDDRQPVPAGRTGRVFVGSSLVLESYTGGEKGDVVDGLWPTGDLGHLEHGRLFLEGRRDDMIVSGGENVHPAEVEEVLKAHPAVADAAVVGVADARFGQALHAYVVPRGPGAREDRLLEYLRKRLASFKVPKQLTFVAEVPRNPAGKVQRRRLQAARGPSRHRPRRSRARPLT